MDVCSLVHDTRPHPSISTSIYTILHGNDLWYFRLGHVSNKNLSHMTLLYPSIYFYNKATCDIRHLARQKNPFCHSSSTTNSKFKTLHLDIWGHLSIPLVHNHKYFLTILDDYTRYMWIVLLKTKDEVSTKVKQFITKIQTKFHITPKTIKTNNGPEFLLQSFYDSIGINHQRSCVETSQQNGRVERKHQHLLNVGRALLYQAKLPKQYWSYALFYAIFIINRILTSTLKNQSPYQIFHDKILEIDLFKVFGSLYYASTLSVHRTKLDPKV